MKAATHYGRCLCADQCRGNSRGEHVYSLDELMEKLNQMLTNPDQYDMRYSAGDWDKVWLGPDDFVVLGRFWDDFYVTEEAAVYIRSFLSYDLGVYASSLLSWYRQDLCTQRAMLSAWL